jgi:phenylacetate-CoA ligase
MSTQKERDELADFFGCPVLDEYSSEELTRIAAQCIHKKYHVFEDINYMETVTTDGQVTSEAGLLVGTNLHNTAMPMIRYQQNDLGHIVSVSCDCGWRFRELRDLQGRKNDSFIMPSGKVLTSGFLLDATYDFLLDDRTAVRDFCLIQQDANLVVLEIAPGKGWDDSIDAKIKRQFGAFLEEDVTFEIRCVDECTKTKTGKRNPIINMMNRTEPSRRSTT